MSGARPSRAAAGAGAGRGASAAARRQDGARRGGGGPATGSVADSADGTAPGAAAAALPARPSSGTGNAARRPQQAPAPQPGPTPQTALALALDQLLAGLGEAPAPAGEPALGDAPPALTELGERLGLSRFERALLLLAAAPDLDARFGSRLAALHGDAGRPWASLALACERLPGAEGGALTPVGRLRRWQLIELVGPGGPLQARLQVDETVLHRLRGFAYPEPRLEPWCAPSRPEAARVDGAGDMQRIEREWGGAPSLAAAPVFVVAGADAPAFVHALAARLGMQLCRFTPLGLPATPAERETLMRLVERETLWSHALLWTDCEGLDGADLAVARAMLERLQALVVVTGLAPGAEISLQRGLRRIERSSGGMPQRLARWQQALGADPAGPAEGDAEPAYSAVAEQFELDAGAVERIAAAQPAGSGPGLAARLWDAARTESRRPLDGLAQRVASNAGWADLVLPEPATRVLRTIAAQVRQRGRVYRDWGFADLSPRGLGLSALFSGGSGTGKTLAAEVLANELRLDLFRVDVGAMVSKYIGETEKNLSRLFDAAQASGAILLFDEADALFGKRTEVRDSHDRYANIEVSHLLQRIEAYRGLSILTTNLKQSIDPAFQRRIRFVLHFPFPDEAARRAIWQRVFPPRTPKHIDEGRLARLSLSGGVIRNVALNAAFLAAEDGQPVTMRHLQQAAEAEFIKTEQPLPVAELGDWT